MAQVKQKALIVNSIKNMRKKQCIEACKDLDMNTAGKVGDIRDRLAGHYDVDLAADDEGYDTKGPKHKAEWSQVQVPITRAEFTNQDFNV